MRRVAQMSSENSSSSNEDISSKLRNGSADTVTFDNLHHLFQSGDMVYKTQSPHQICQVWLTGLVDNVVFQIDAYYLGCDGLILIPIWERFNIPRYQGERRIVDIVLNPTVYFADIRGTLRDAIQSGKWYVILSTTMTHVGMRASTMGDQGSSSKETLIVDISVYREEHKGEILFHTFPADQFPSAPAEVQLDSLTDEHYAMCSKDIRAYNLQSHEWSRLHVDDLVKITSDPNPVGFENIALPDDHMKMIKALLRTNKGRELKCLLHGSPGVGKTFTTECAADFIQKPLYSISGHDLTRNAEKLEQQLMQHIRRAAKWDCVLVFEDADYLLERRDKGILFMTASEGIEFDSAFKSKIHVSLYYPPLDQKRTLGIWRMNLDKIDRSNDLFSKYFDIMEFGKAHWEDNPRLRYNGRQIRDAFTIAVGLAKSSPTPEGSFLLDDGHFRQVADILEKFDDHIFAEEETHSDSDSEAIPSVYAEDEDTRSDDSQLYSDLGPVPGIDGEDEDVQSDNSSLNSDFRPDLVDASNISKNFEVSEHQRRERTGGRRGEEEAIREAEREIADLRARRASYYRRPD
ncbi:hypothetical protein BDV95DRAFT_592999 [Massariosphaeria phaeospora]|uniref:AAA+ ATPase domain-containing protein n=1 Tax=Massariosphaeria phaeospora TaxID=100035 RepID=A0A7C8MD39_9PLEO|nr:hypothetical protein BDV95DRAFT_592999 [Massariosphaeria phaeospora]